MDHLIDGDEVLSVDEDEFDDKKAKQGDDDEYEVEKIVDDITQNGKRFYLVKWAGGQTTWQPEAKVGDCEQLEAYLTEKQQKDKKRKRQATHVVLPSSTLVLICKWPTGADVTLKLTVAKSLTVSSLRDLVEKRTDVPKERQLVYLFSSSTPSVTVYDPTTEGEQVIDCDNLLERCEYICLEEVMQTFPNLVQTSDKVVLTVVHGADSHVVSLLPIATVSSLRAEIQTRTGFGARDHGLTVHFPDGDFLLYDYDTPDEALIRTLPDHARARVIAYGRSKVVVQTTSEDATLHNLQLSMFRSSTVGEVVAAIFGMTGKRVRLSTHLSDVLSRCEVSYSYLQNDTLMYDIAMVDKRLFHFLSQLTDSVVCFTAVVDAGGEEKVEDVGAQGEQDMTPTRSTSALPSSMPAGGREKGTAQTKQPCKFCTFLFSAKSNFCPGCDNHRDAIEEWQKKYPRARSNPMKKGKKKCW